MVHGKQPTVLAIGCGLGLLLFSAGEVAAGGKAAKFTGVVYDLDYIQKANWCQVLIRDGFVGFVRDPRFQIPLEAAMKLGVPVTVYHDNAKPQQILSVVLERKLPAAPLQDGLHYVKQLDIHSQDKCDATLVGVDGKEVKVFTRDLRMESILTTALREGWKIGYLSFDPKTKEITRGKLNIEDQK